MGALADTVVRASAIVGAIIAIFGVIFSAYRWYLKQCKQDVDIKSIKEEQRLTTEVLVAVLDGLEQVGANHTVPTAKRKLQEYLNNQAHK